MIEKDEMVLKLKEFKELKRMKEEIEIEMKSLEDVIKSDLIEKDLEQLIVGEYKIKWTTVISNRLDSKKLKEDYSDIYSLYVKESVSKRFSIV